jgi:hypothetical protein
VDPSGRGGLRAPSCCWLMTSLTRVLVSYRASEMTSNVNNCNNAQLPGPGIVYRRNAFCNLQCSGHVLQRDPAVRNSSQTSRQKRLALKAHRCRDPQSSWPRAGVAGVSQTTTLSLIPRQKCRAIVNTLIWVDREPLVLCSGANRGHDMTHRCFCSIEEASLQNAQNS